VIVMARPHEEIKRRRRWRAEYDANIAALEAKYGLPYEKLPEALRLPPPEHPRRENARRYDNRSNDTWRSWLRARVENRLGWRTLRRHYLASVEKFRQAEIVVRKLRAKRTGRGKPLDRKAHVHARERIDAREWRDEL